MTDDTRATLDEIAAAAVSHFAFPGSVRLSFVRHGENTTYRIDTRGGERFALRLHRPHYQTVRSIESEVAWMLALRETGLVTPPPLCGADGKLVQTADARDGTERLVTAFTWMDGVPLPRLDRLDLWRRLGELMALVHEQARRWTPPVGFTRDAWDLAALVGERPRWGDPYRLGSWDNETARLLLACRAAVRERLAEFGASSDRFGLVHADLSFENVLVQDDGTTVVIDFDDSGPGWFLYDLAVALHPFEHRHGFTERRNALIGGYRSVADVAHDFFEELPTLLMARRLATLGWMFTHGETAHARRQRTVRLGVLPMVGAHFLEWAASAAPPARPDDRAPTVPRL
jgi:Ser/Thr protein kinase RdoA (MazF antagonist)